MMTTHCHEETGPHFDIQVHKISRVPSIYHPVIADVLIPIFRRMTKLFEVILILPVTLNIHAACIPVTLLRHGLRIPMRPCTKLGITPPLRDGVKPAQFLPVSCVLTGQPRLMVEGSIYQEVIPDHLHQQLSDQYSQLISLVTRLMISVALEGIEISIMAYRNESERFPEEWIFNFWMG